MDSILRKDDTMADIPKPITREDMYYDYLINGSGTLPKPITRREMYLYYLCTNGFGGEGTVTPEMIDAAVDAALKLAKEYTDDAVSNAGYSLGLNIDSDYIMTIELKNADDTVVSKKSIDFPIESMVVGASYAEGIVTLSLQSGDEIDVDVSDLVNGLVSDSFTIAGINMKDAITAKELKNALGVTADDVGALPLTGGEMQGNIRFESLEGDYKIVYPKTIQMKIEGAIDMNSGYINRVEEINFSDKTKPVRSDAILTTKEQINSNTDTEKVAGAVAVKAISNEIGNNLASIIKIQTTQKAVNVTLPSMFGKTFKEISGNDFVVTVPEGYKLLANVDTRVNGSGGLQSSFDGNVSVTNMSLTPNLYLFNGFQDEIVNVLVTVYVTSVFIKSITINEQI